MLGRVESSADVRGHPLREAVEHAATALALDPSIEQLMTYGDIMKEYLSRIVRQDECFYPHRALLAAAKTEDLEVAARALGWGGTDEIGAKKKFTQAVDSLLAEVQEVENIKWTIRYWLSLGNTCCSSAVLFDLSITTDTQKQLLANALWWMFFKLETDLKEFPDVFVLWQETAIERYFEEVGFVPAELKTVLVGRDEANLPEIAKWLNQTVWFDVIAGRGLYAIERLDAISERCFEVSFSGRTLAVMPPEVQFLCETAILKSFLLTVLRSFFIPELSELQKNFCPTVPIRDEEIAEALSSFYFGEAISIITDFEARCSRRARSYAPVIDTVINRVVRNFRLLMNLPSAGTLPGLKSADFHFNSILQSAILADGNIRNKFSCK